MGDVTKSIKSRTKAIAAKYGHGWELLTEAYDNWWLKRDQGLGGLRQKWEKFLSEAERIYVPKITSEDWWKEKYDPVYQARMDAAIERQRQDRVRLQAEPEPETEIVLPPGEAF
jgi:hypothetical protein